MSNYHPNDGDDLDEPNLIPGDPTFPVCLHLGRARQWDLSLYQLHCDDDAVDDDDADGDDDDDGDDHDDHDDHDDDRKP